MLLEAVPNLSLGPQDPLLDRIVDKLKATQTPGWALLDTHTDPDHNRTVLTLAGARAPLLSALDTLINLLLEQGSLIGHDGVHPRIGLLDVLPFVALHPPHTTPAKHTALTQAHTLAAHNIPIYLYGDIATTPPREQLATIRRHIHWPNTRSPLDPRPDLGPSQFHPTLGATCVGVRGPLIAYNVLLDSTNLEAGQTIARQLRATNDGLPGLQALAFPLASQGDRIQISTNITRPGSTTPADVYAAVTTAARPYHIHPVEGELVGLAPAASLPADPAAMGLDELPPSLEERLRAANLLGASDQLLR